ncbi:MAG: GTP cyclohydrolase I, partial [Bacilli bacterium]|nr:GTP cyclohydrolase I [Bacilli bacterium]
QLQPKGVMVIVSAQHDCMRIRGVKKQNSHMVTSAIKGEFKNAEARNEFLKLID